MQPDVITLSVDEQNDGVGPVNHVYNRFEENTNRSGYIGVNHSLTARDTLTLYRTLPKVSGNFKGVAKTAFKFTKDYTVPGVDGSNLTAPVIFEGSFSIPVGVDADDILVERQKALAMLDLDSVMTPLNSQQMI